MHVPFVSPSVIYCRTILSPIYCFTYQAEFELHNKVNDHKKKKKARQSHMITLFINRGHAQEGNL